MVINKRAQFFILSAVIIAAIVVSLATVRNYVVVGDAPQKMYTWSEMLEEETGAVVDYALYSSSAPGATGSVADFLQKGVAMTISKNPDIDIVSCYSDVNEKLVCQNNGTMPVTIKAGNFEKELSGSKMKTIVVSRMIDNGQCYIFEKGEDDITDIKTDFPCPNSCVGDWAGGEGSLFFYEGLEPLQFDCSNLSTYINSLPQSKVETIGCPTGSDCSVSGIDISRLKTINISSANGNYEIPVSNITTTKNQFYFILSINTTSGSYVSIS